MIKKKITPKKDLSKKPTESQIVKKIDQYSHSDKERPKSSNDLEDKYLFKILNVDIDFIDKLLKTKKDQFSHIVNTYFKMSGQGKFNDISSKKEKSVLEKVRQKRIKKYGLDYEKNYRKTEEEQFEEWDREEEEENE